MECLRFKLHPSGQEYAELEVFASNGRFSGRVSKFPSHEDLSQLLEDLRGFPRSIDQEVKFSLGTICEDKDEFASGYVAFRWYCLDGRGHVGIDITLQDDDYSNLSGRAEFTISCLPLEIDRFVVQFERVIRSSTGEASLDKNDEQAGAYNP
jgi:hypothetical protein